MPVEVTYADDFLRIPTIGVILHDPTLGEQCNFDRLYSGLLPEHAFNSLTTRSASTFRTSLNGTHLHAGSTRHSLYPQIAFFGRRLVHERGRL